MSKAWRFVLTGGLVAGTCDIVYAGVFWGISRGLSPQRIGLVSHYVIATSMAVAYYLVARRWAPLWQRPIPYGTAYGLLLYGIMTYVVVPSSAANPGSKDPLWVGLSILVHMLLIGLPIALFARRAILVTLRSQAPPPAAEAHHA